MSEDISCDVLIVGAGITGALCSYNFTKSNISTVLVDKNIIRYESTRANTALLQYEIVRNLIELQKLIGYDNAVTCFKESAKALLRSVTLLMS